ncbi:hypothetical protein [Ideonella livida]|uniref:Uncharacterized protein n=1 Tax=Ideonella livida TaxID=2707176 RepID=A0A7C9TMC5_9BURK|nr:hypothetical protein [Ideonella livida]NDY91566.1 hypothetical protein [Ideonella livida]
MTMLEMPPLQRHLSAIEEASSVHDAQAADASPALWGWLAGLDAQQAARRATPRDPLPDYPSLWRFRHWMREVGHEVQLPRLRYDRRYAGHCLALAHASGHDRLRRLALQIFQHRERRGGLS